MYSSQDSASIDINLGDSMPGRLRLQTMETSTTGSLHRPDETLRQMRPREIRGDWRLSVLASAFCSPSLPGIEPPKPISIDAGSWAICRHRVWKKIQWIWNFDQNISYEIAIEYGIAAYVLIERTLPISLETSYLSNNQYIACDRPRCKPRCFFSRIFRCKFRASQGWNLMKSWPSRE